MWTLNYTMCWTLPLSISNFGHFQLRLRESELRIIHLVERFFHASDQFHPIFSEFKEFLKCHDSFTRNGTWLTTQRAESMYQICRANLVDVQLVTCTGDARVVANRLKFDWCHRHGVFVPNNVLFSKFRFDQIWTRDGAISPEANVVAVAGCGPFSFTPFFAVGRGQKGGRVSFRPFFGLVDRWQVVDLFFPLARYTRPFAFPPSRHFDQWAIDPIFRQSFHRKQIAPRTLFAFYRAHGWMDKSEPLTVHLLRYLIHI